MNRNAPPAVTFEVRIRLCCCHCGAELQGPGLRMDARDGRVEFERNTILSAERTLMVRPEHECAYLKFVEPEESESA